MAIDRPGAIEPHPRCRPEGRERSGGRQAEHFFCLLRGMPSAGIPAPLRGVARPGRSRPAAVAGRRSRRSRSSARFAYPRFAWRALNEREETWRQQAAGCKSTNATGAERLALAYQRRWTKLAKPIKCVSARMTPVALEHSRSRMGHARTCRPFKAAVRPVTLRRQLCLLGFDHVEFQRLQ